MTRDLLAGVVVAVTFGAGGMVAAVAAAEDARTGRLRNALTAAIAAIALAGLGLAAVVAGDTIRLVGMLIGAATFSLPWFAAHLVSRSGVGFGDVKLAAGLGLYLGWIDPILSPIALVVATGLFAMANLARGAATDEPRPFGPALVAGAFVATVLGLMMIT